MQTNPKLVLMACVLSLAGAAGAQTVTVQHTLDYRNNELFNDSWFVEAGATLDHSPFYRGATEDWGWTHDVEDSMPDGATGIQSATLTIVSWKIDVENGEDDVIYALPEEPLTTGSIRWTGTRLGLLKSYFESPISVPWSGSGNIAGYEDFWSVTTFELSPDLLDDLWTNGQLYFHVDLDQTLESGMRGTVESSTLQITYFAPEPVTPPTVNVHRFWSPLISSHFYTTSEVEATTLIRDYSYAWTYEGVVYQTLSDDRDPLAMPVYRFWSPVVSGHFYTIHEEEVQFLLANYQNIWVYEGVAFHAYPANLQLEGTHPVYRFWSPVVSHHFYTISEDEKQFLIDQYPDVWIYEGVAWHAFMP